MPMNPHTRNPKNTYRVAGVLAFSLILTMPSCDRYVPPEAIAPPASQLADSLATFGQDTRKNQLVPYKKEFRRDMVAAKLREIIVAQNWNHATVVQALSGVPAISFLCLPRYRYELIATRLGSLEAVGKILSDRLQKPSDDIGTLLKSLAADYTITVDNKPASDGKEPSYTQWLGQDATTGARGGRLCRDAIENGDALVTRDVTQPEAGGAAAAIALIDTIWTVLKPVLVGSLQNIDQERRARAVRDYFSDDQNVERLKRYLSRVEGFLDDEFEISHKRLAGRAIVAHSVLFDASTAHWAKVEAVAGTPNCRAAALRSGKDATNVACFDAALSALREPIDVALGAAESFDAGIEQTLPGAGDKLSGKIDTLRDIALGRNPAEDQVKALWAAALRYTALYKNFETAASSDNKKKATDAWNTFIKSIDDH